MRGVVWIEFYLATISCIGYRWCENEGVPEYNSFDTRIVCTNTTHILHGRIKISQIEETPLCKTSAFIWANGYEFQIKILRLKTQSRCFKGKEEREKGCFICMLFEYAKRLVSYKETDHIVVESTYERSPLPKMAFHLESCHPYACCSFKKIRLIALYV